MWVVDTCVVIDVLEDDPEFGRRSAERLQKLLHEGLVVAPVTMAELAPAFEGDLAAQKSFLSQAGLSFSEAWTSADTEAAHQAWWRYTAARRAEKLPRRLIADILIGAFAANRSGLVTRNPEDFRRWFPTLRVKVP